jgi:hypothetical protein
VDTVGLVGFAQSNNPINPIKNLTPKTTQTTSNQTQIMQQKIKEKKIHPQPQHKFQLTSQVTTNTRKKNSQQTNANGEILTSTITS